MNRSLHSLVLVLLLAAPFAALGEDGDNELATIFFEDFSGQGASSAKQPDEWVNPKWDMPRSPDGKWWIIGTSWYGPNKNKPIAQQGMMGNIGIGRYRWATTRDFHIAPDPIENEFLLTFKVLSIGYMKGAMHVRVVDDQGNGYGCVLAMDSESTRAHKWTNRLVRWGEGEAKEAVLAEAPSPDQRLTRNEADGELIEVALRLKADGALTLEIDGEVVAQAEDANHRRFTALGFSVEYESRFTIDDIKLATKIALPEE